jgi:mannose-1-phosphate guanylyltransferase
MLNGDVLTDIDITAQIAAHERCGARATLGLYPVDDPSAYGLVRLNADRSVKGFVEKPAPDQIDTNNISAGVYVLERSVLDLLTYGEPASIERDVFPQLVGDGLFGHVSDGYWKDIGTPERYLEATFDILEGSVVTEVGKRLGETFLCVEDGVEADGRIVPAALVEQGCVIHEHARIGGRAVLEHGVTVGAGTTIEGAVVMAGTTIGEHCTLRGCIVAGNVTIGDNCVIDGMSVLGEGVTLGAGNTVSKGARLFPGVSLPEGALLF